VTNEDLDGIDRALSPLVLGVGNTAQAIDVATRFNASVEQARSSLAAARAAHEQGRSVDSDVEVRLKAYALMFAGERERIVRDWAISLARSAR
jgi:hypothetical protein